jgi:hypothetical protein
MDFAHLATCVEAGGGISAVGRAEDPGAVASHYESAIRESGRLRQLGEPGDARINDRTVRRPGREPRGVP